MVLTSHFRTRAQQRGIRPPLIEMILNLGQTNGKGDLVLLGRKDIEEAIREKKEELRALEKIRTHGVGVAVDSETLVTCFHRHKKFKR